MLKTSLCLPDLPRRQELAIDLRCSVDATGDGREAERWNRCRTNGQLSAPYPPELLISRKSFSEKYVRLPEVESGVSCISFEMYQDNLASKADTPSKLYHIDLKDYQGRLHLIIPKRNPIFAVSGNRRTY